MNFVEVADQLRDWSESGEVDFVRARVFLGEQKVHLAPDERRILMDYVDQSPSLMIPEKMQGEGWVRLCLENLDHPFYERMLSSWNDPDILCQWAIVYTVMDDGFKKDDLEDAWSALLSFTAWRGWELLPSQFTKGDFSWDHQEAMERLQSVGTWEVSTGELDPWVEISHDDSLAYHVLTWNPMNSGCSSRCFHQRVRHHWRDLGANEPDEITPYDPVSLAKIAIETRGQIIYDHQWLEEVPFESVTETKVWRDAVTAWGGTPQGENHD